jgi:hypothetical protein
MNTTSAETIEDEEEEKRAESPKLFMSSHESTCDYKSLPLWSIVELRLPYKAGEHSGTS